MRKNTTGKIGVVDFSNRYDLCGKVFNCIEFSLSLLNSTLIWGYLAIFDFDISPNLRVTIIALILLKVLLCILASLAIYLGLRNELAKILKFLGIEMRKVKTVREMVYRIEDRDLQLKVMG